ncbi:MULTISPECIES: sigma-54-dependent Fis family transcriptional regulator [Pseudomonas syringae group]|uniref:sigma-54-dependent Fis family transcriptional regulator n=1 Tax=Pseudomonas syringae group TaxID=136849 RepID=UPI0006B60402|nr:sigma-54-dependent Fis family transcriptional regulator [Pseudomonas coronafaciens]KPB49707.1 Sigma-54 dependent transcriptional regulator [Pseudomonas coronafaciens pv. oryzae]KPY04461.1 Sigma-54 dependent transcriptional regulator [Pseudomonas coronafaciens pv. oryzae]RMT08204.1 Sigma-54 dependent transcriptional regulator [Pseudomonas coronafaciens pv. oryzae]RMV85634.1 Sigma-54 dependent transcriptional regulator [Pseudomonas coronafaciens pv. garcae]
MNNPHSHFPDHSASIERASPRGDSTHFDVGDSPTAEELTSCLFFSPDDGRIWLNDQRMLLLHSSSFGTLRHEIIERLGQEQARGMFTRAGYLSGARDARLIRERWPLADATSAFRAGTHLHTLEGMTKVEPLHFKFDAESGFYEGEFLWHNSCEADAHVAAYGVGQDPVCWTEVGYAIGFVSGLFGQMVIFREVECRGMGHAHCRVIGKTAEQWGDVERDLSYLSVLSSPGPAHQTPFAPSHDQAPPAGTDQPLIGASAAFNSATQALQRVAMTPATVLISGESGVGKEMFARQLHQLSRHRDGPFVALNCAAIPDNLIEAELFGVERGAYTGATHSRPGRFERANGGTLFLDEITSLSLAGQSKLLRALQEREIERVGGGHGIKVHVRVVAATNVDLRKAVTSGDFREDLFYRLNVYPIALPPLRERRDDIPLLINAFLKRFCQEYGRTPAGLTMRALKTLLRYDFAGNVRELQNLIERGLIASDEGQAIDLVHIFRNESLPAGSYSLNHDGVLARATSVAGETVPEAGLLDSLAQNDQAFSIDDLEQRLIREALDKSHGNLSAASRLLGLSRAQFAYRLKKCPPKAV